MKRKLGMMVFAISMGIMSTVANADGKIEQNNVEITSETSSRIKDHIETKYRYHNGHVQYRRWNATQGYWVDPYWINAT